MLRNAVAEVKIDQALVGNPGFDGHALEILHHIFGKAHGDRLLELGGVGVPAGFQFGEVVFDFHGCSLP